MSFGENRQQPVSREIYHSWFLLTTAQNPGKPTKIRGFRPKKPLSCRLNPFFTCHRYRTRPRTKSKHSADPRVPPLSQDPCTTPLPLASNTKIAHPRSKNGAMKPWARPNLMGSMPHSAIMSSAAPASLVPIADDQAANLAAYAGRDCRRYRQALRSFRGWWRH